MLPDAEHHLGSYDFETRYGQVVFQDQNGHERLGVDVLVAHPDGQRTPLPQPMPEIGITGPGQTPDIPLATFTLRSWWRQTEIDERNGVLAPEIAKRVRDQINAWAHALDPNLRPTPLDA